MQAGGGKRLGGAPGLWGWMGPRVRPWPCGPTQLPLPRAASCAGPSARPRKPRGRCRSPSRLVAGKFPAYL